VSPRTSGSDEPEQAPAAVAEPEGDDVLPLTDFEKEQAAAVAEAEKAEADEPS
jgi:hypothetical protein